MSNGKYVNGGVELYTYFHTSQDIEKLMTMLNNRYGLICSMYDRKQGLYKVIIAKQSVKLLQTIVLPHILPFMKHKIGLYTHSTFSLSAYKIRLLANKRSNRFYTTLNSPSQNLLNPYYITGFLFFHHLRMMKKKHKTGRVALLYRYINIINLN